MDNITWTTEPGTLNKISPCGRYRATYRNTSVTGFATYWIHAIETPVSKRTLGNAISVGGLRLPKVTA